MRVFQCPAQYRRLIEAAMAIAVADAHRDAKRREAGRHGTRATGAVPERLVDPSATGTLIVMVGTHEESTSDPFADAVADVDSDRPPLTLRSA